MLRYGHTHNHDVAAGNEGSRAAKPGGPPRCQIFTFATQRSPDAGFLATPLIRSVPAMVASARLSCSIPASNAARPTPPV